MIFKKFPAAILLITIVFLFASCSNSTTNSKIESDSTKKLSMSDSIPIPSKIKVLSPDSFKVFYIDSSSSLTDTQFNSRKELKVDGDVFFEIARGNFPLYITTSLMKIQVLAPSTFRVTAYDADQGQSVETLKGTVIISKAYSSPFPDPDTLHENNLYMVNKSIDLSEKEDLDDDKLARWWDQLKMKSLQ
jgi:hypothetical protein